MTKRTTAVRLGWLAVVAGAALALGGGCRSSEPEDGPAGSGTALQGLEQGGKPAEPGTAAPTTQPADAAQEVAMKATAFLEAYQRDLAEAEKKQTLAYWQASNSGKKEDFAAFAAADLALKKLHSDPVRYAELRSLLEHKAGLPPLSARALEIAELAFKGNQLPPEMLEELVRRSSEIEQIFNTYRGELAGKKYTNNELLEMLRVERSSAARQAIWEALKQVGAEVGPRLVELAKVRNAAARKLGYADYWDMQVRLQEHDPVKLLALFAELEELTAQPFAQMKQQLDGELAARFGVAPEELMPWHYDNPFFQAPPPSAELDLDEFYKDKRKEDIVELARRFYEDIGLPIDDIIARSDLFERDGKDQHAFCIAIDRRGDVRSLLNVKPTMEWMGTMLHEEGHAAYYKYLDFSLPYNLREAAHIFTTEAVAMLFGALSQDPAWLIGYAGAAPERVSKVKTAILEQRRREQLIFARWAAVMLHFEKQLYADPDGKLNQQWWDTVERYQLLRRPAGRDLPDWAAKPHFTIAPVYYHNYLLGEVFASQLRATLARLTGHQGPVAELSFNGRKDFGKFFKEKIFAPGMRTPWPQYVQQATGEPLTARHFAAELAQPATAP